ncbi:hypothetical protein SNE40_004048 [Patella caerulea]|uniref:IGFBP N-terminal domain-containing protein n=1 Tax=Patella caerulea TaxID=87958 RepID=A0AAN8Q1H1_PATCE
MKSAVLVCCVLVLTFYSQSEATSCLQCSPDVVCEALPSYCQAGRATCGCCDVCRGKLGEKCTALSVPCESHLICIDDNGQQAANWWDYGFKGTCRAATKDPRCQ